MKMTSSGFHSVALQESYMYGIIFIWYLLKKQLQNELEYTNEYAMNEGAYYRSIIINEYDMNTKKAARGHLDNH